VTRVLGGNGSLGQVRNQHDVILGGRCDGETRVDSIETVRDLRNGGDLVEIRVSDRLGFDSHQGVGRVHVEDGHQVGVADHHVHLVFDEQQAVAAGDRVYHAGGGGERHLLCHAAGRHVVELARGAVDHVEAAVGERLDAVGVEALDLRKA